MIGEKIKATRIRSGISQDELSEAAQLSVRTIQRIENGETEPRGDSLRRIATALNITVEELTNEIEGEATNAPMKEDKFILILLNLSAFGYLIYPFLGILFPMVLWMLYKDKVSNVDETGKRLMIYQVVLCAIIYLVPTYLFFVEMHNMNSSVYIFRMIFIITMSVYVTNAIIILSNVTKLLITKRMNEAVQ